MGMQLEMFEQPTDLGKISSLIRSSDYFETGISLAEQFNYNKVEKLIDLFYHYMAEIDFNVWASKNSFYYTLLEFTDDKVFWFLTEMEDTGFYLCCKWGGEERIAVLIYEWKDNDQWGDFDLAKLIEKYIRKNRQTFDSILKGTSNL